MSQANESATRRPIVVAVGATGGVPALRIARALAARDATELVIVSAVEPPPLYAIEPRRELLVPWTIEEQIAERGRNIRERLQRLGWSGAELDSVIETPYGDAGSAIADAARSHGARLIVMGIGPHSIARRLLATGTAWATSRRAPCPVLAVSDRARDLPRVVVAATDFSPESINAAQQALPLLGDDAVVYLVHAWSRLESAIPIAELTALNDAYAASLPARFDKVRELLTQGRTLGIHTEAVEGKAADVVLAAARARHADLVVGGTHGHGVLERWLMGSTSTAILYGAECSVLLAPEPPVAERTRLLRHMTGTSTVFESAQWNDELQAFVRRNADRRTTLEIDDRDIGAQVQESGYALVGATYDAHDQHLALMFGGGATGRPHLTRSLGSVRSIAVASGPRDQDRALCIESEGGSALLTFLDEQQSVRSSVNA